MHGAQLIVSHGESSEREGIAFSALARQTYQSYSRQIIFSNGNIHYPNLGLWHEHLIAQLNSSSLVSIEQLTFDKPITV